MLKSIGSALEAITKSEAISDDDSPVAQGAEEGPRRTPTAAPNYW
jgi:hypothetical protein